MSESHLFFLLSLFDLENLGLVSGWLLEKKLHSLTDRVRAQQAKQFVKAWNGCNDSRETKD
jgi:hypothetical protein